MNNNNISIFNNDNFGELRVVIKDGEPWFVAKDVCSIIKHTNPRMAIQGLDDDEKGVSKVYTPGGTQEVTVISEAGLYTLLVRSNKEIAKPFRRWVTHEVLPSIRKHGLYATPQTITDLLRQPENMLEILKELQAEQAARLNAEDKIAVLAPAAEKYDKYLTAGENESIGTFAKAVGEAGIKVGVDQLFDVFRFKRVLCSGQGVNYNQPYSNYVRAGLMTTKPIPPEKKNKWRSTPLVTPRGRDYFLPRLAEWIREHREFNRLGRSA